MNADIEFLLMLNTHLRPRRKPQRPELQSNPINQVFLQAPASTQTIRRNPGKPVWVVGLGLSLLLQQEDTVLPTLTSAKVESKKI